MNTFLQRLLGCKAPFKGPGEGATNRNLQNHIKYLVLKGSNFKFYFNFLIEISSNSFFNTFLDFPKRIAIIGIYSKINKIKFKIRKTFRKPVPCWDKISRVLRIF